MQESLIYFKTIFFIDIFYSMIHFALSDAAVKYTNSDAVEA